MPCHVLPKPLILRPGMARADAVLEEIDNTSTHQKILVLKRKYLLILFSLCNYQELELIVSTINR
jgi:hypothetical protein